MNIAIQNIHRAGITGFAFHGYIAELVKEGYVSHLYFDEDPRKTEAFQRVRKTYSWKALGLDRAKLVFGDEVLDADVLLSFESLPADFTPAVKRFKGLKIFHLMDYFWSEPLSEKVKRLKEYGVDYVFSYGSPDKYCAYFNKHAPEYAGKVIPLPFGYGARFVSSRPFSERKKKCVAVGSVRPLRFEGVDPAFWQEASEAYAPEVWFHHFRRQLVEHKSELAPVMDSMLPEFPRYRDYDYDMVAKLNEYQLFTSDESIFSFPSAKAFEGPAAGAAMVCSTHPCFKDFGFRDGENCLMHAERSTEDFSKKVSGAIADQAGLERLAREGKRFVEAHYSHPVIAAKLVEIIEGLHEARMQGRKVEGLADRCYETYRRTTLKPGLSRAPLLDAVGCRQQRAWYTLGAGWTLVRGEVVRLFDRIRGRLLRDALRVKTRLYRPLVTLLYDTHPIDAWRKKAFFKQRGTVSALPVPTELEQRAIDTLRQEVAAFPPVPTDLVLDPPAQKWRKFSTMLRERILADDPRQFLTWEVIRSNMGYRANTRELAFLRNSRHWNEWRAGLGEPSSINPHPFFAWPETSENTVRQAFHLAQFRRTTGTRLTDADVIVDFGGGYGGMARLVQALGFKGTYIIFDWPEFLALQRFYLTLAGVSAPILRDPKDVSAPAIVQVSDLDQLRTVIDGLPANARKALIATWSLSEAPVALRDQIFATVRPDDCLLTYQERFAGVLNRPYFSKLSLDHPRISWYEYPMSYIPAEKNRYLIGRTPSSV